MDYLLTTETMLREISMLAWSIRTRVRYDGTLPFRAVIMVCVLLGWGLLHADCEQAEKIILKRHDRHRMAPGFGCYCLCAAEQRASFC